MVAEMVARDVLRDTSFFIQTKNHFVNVGLVVMIH